MTPRALLEWFEHRSGAGQAVRAFLEESVPRSTGWRNTLGSAAGALILVQILTGILLMLFYVPHPDSAFASLEYVSESLRAGWLVRALHYWGASFIVVALFVHMARVFFAGAYRKPRELTWLVGLALFGVVMGLAFTGQLLSWNQAGYWAAKVGIEIGSSAPVAGPIIKQLLMGGETLGALTLTRFYTLHVVLLPLALGALVPLHLFLLRRHGPARPASDLTSESVPFFPGQLARDLVTISAALLGLLMVAAIFRGPDAVPIDLTDTSYVPRPEWYFLSHFEILRFTPGRLKIVATFVLPNVLLLLLAAVPWLDRARSTAIADRKVLVGAGALVIAGIVSLTVLGLTTGHKKETAGLAEDGTYDVVQAGRLRFEENQCANCHRINGKGMVVGPDLSNVGLRLREDYMREWVRDPKQFRPDTMMPAAKVDRAGLNELVAYLMTLQQTPEH